MTPTLAAEPEFEFALTKSADGALLVLRGPGCLASSFTEPPASNWSQPDAIGCEVRSFALGKTPCAFQRTASRARGETRAALPVVADMDVWGPQDIYA